MIAIHFVASLFSRAILAATVRGTDKNMPTGPRSQPQIIRDMKTTSADSPSPRPKYLGSIKLPTNVLVRMNRPSVMTA